MIGDAGQWNKANGVIGIGIGIGNRYIDCLIRFYFSLLLRVGLSSMEQCCDYSYVWLVRGNLERIHWVGRDHWLGDEECLSSCVFAEISQRLHDCWATRVSSSWLTVCFAKGPSS